MILKAYCESLDCDRVHRGADCIKAYKENVLILHNTNIIDFTPYMLIGGDYDDLTPSQMREQAYGTMRVDSAGTPLIVWEDGCLTVDEAADLWGKYAAEGNEKAGRLTLLVSEAKEYIRELHPDETTQ